MSKQSLYTMLLLILCLLSLSFGVLAQDDADLTQAVAVVLAQHAEKYGSVYAYKEVGRDIDERGGILHVAVMRDGEQVEGLVDLAVVVRDGRQWKIYLPGDAGYTAAWDALSPGVVRSSDSLAHRPTADPDVMDVASLTGYQLPWEDGQWGTVTRSFGRHGLGEIDFDIGGRSVAAVKDGTIVYINDSHHLTTFASGAWWYWNTVVIEHSPYEYSLYGHLEPNSVPAELREQCDADLSQINCNIPVKAGTVIGKEGNTGFSTAYHIHIEFGQSFGIAAYPDIFDEDQDGDRLEAVHSAFIYREQNVGFQGYSVADTAAWEYGKLLQAAHRDEPYPGVNMVYNGNFDLGTEGWRPSGQINWTVEDGVMRFLRLNTTEPPDWGAFHQDLWYGIPANMPFEVRFMAGNTSGVAKTISVMFMNTSGLHYGGARCDFSVPAGTSLQPYVMRGTTDSTWASARLYIGVNPPDGSPAALIDNIEAVRLRERVPETVCN